MSPRPQSITHTSIPTFMFHVVHPGSGVYLFSHIPFYDIHYLTLVDLLFCSIFGVVINYDDYLYNTNDTDNDTSGGISGVENTCFSTIRYGNNNFSFIDIYDVIVVNLAYNYVPFGATLETISSSTG